MSDCHGYESGEKCNRDGCKGVIAEKEKNSCSCHISPPCSACTEPRAYCWVCDWSQEEEQEENRKASAVPTNYNHIPYKCRTLADLDPTKIDYITKAHTNSSMIKEGVFPEGTSKDDLLEEIRGTFGGRFAYLTEKKFKYIAYTD